MADASVTVSGRELVERVQAFRKFLNRRTPGNALLTFDGSALRIEMPGVAQRIAARGQWSGEARIHGLNILRIASIPADAGEVVIVVVDQALSVHFGTGTLEVTCLWGPVSDSSDGIAVNSDERDVRAFAARAGSSEVERLGLQRKVTVPDTKVDTKLERALQTALRALGRYGVTERELRALVDAKTCGNARVPTPVDPLDMTDPRGCVALVERLQERFGMVDEHLAALSGEAEGERGITGFCDVLRDMQALPPGDQRLYRRLRTCEALLESRESWPTAIRSANGAFP